MSITNNNGSDDNENSQKSKENLRELSYLVEEERLLADLKKKSEETLQKLKVEELTLLRFVKNFSGYNSDINKPIIFQDEINYKSNQNNVSNLNLINNSNISTMVNDVNNTEMLKLNVDNIFMTMENDQEVEMEEEDNSNCSSK